MKKRFVGAGLVAVALFVGACGDSSGGGRSGVASAGGSTSTTEKKKGGGADDWEKAALAFSRCMRANGVDMPDPDPSGMLRAQPGQEQLDADAMKKAEAACKKEREAMQGAMGEPSKDFQDKAVAMSRCMREQGIDMPDPRLSEDGRASVEIDPDQVNDPDFQRAAETCRKQTGMPAPGGAPGPAPGGKQ